MPSIDGLNRWVVRVFAPILVLTGAAGFFVPADLALMSGAPAYNVFHVVAGGVGLLAAFAGGSRAASAFNLGFGIVDLYQAVAGAAGWFPAALFAYRPADDVLHVVLGLGLCAVGAMGFKPPARSGEPG